MTINGTFSAGQQFTADAANNFPRGMVVPPKVITANQTPITTVVDVTNSSTTWTAVSGRIYRAYWSGLVNSDAANTAFNVFIANSSNTLYGQAIIDIVRASVDQVINGSAILSSLSGSVTFKLRAQRQSGTGNCSIIAGATYPFIFGIEDIGAS